MRAGHRASPMTKCKRQNEGDENEGRAKVQKKPKTPLWTQRNRAQKSKRLSAESTGTATKFY